MTKQVIINIVYSPQTGAAKKVFENDKGQIWRNATYDKNKINIGMGWYSIRNPRPSDSIWVVEPYCVLERDYDPKFVNKFKHIFTWATKAFPNEALKDKVVSIHHPTYHTFQSTDALSKNWTSWSERSNEIVFMANNKSSKHHSELYSLRLQLADMLHAKSNFKVSWYGEIPIKRPYFRGKAKSKQDILTKVKFSVCTENSYDPIYTHGYFSEKMPDVWKAGAIPIYMGCYNIDEYKFPDHSYIDLRTYVKKTGKQFKINESALLSRLDGFTEQRYNNFILDIKGQILKPNKLQKIASFDLAYEKIIDTIHND
jgi:hypothetical protein